MQAFGGRCRGTLCVRGKPKKGQNLRVWKGKRVSGKSPAASASQEYRAADCERSCLYKNHQIASLSPRSWPCSSTPLGAVLKPSVTCQKLLSALLSLTYWSSCDYTRAVLVWPCPFPPFISIPFHSHRYGWRYRCFIRLLPTIENATPLHFLLINK